MITFRPASPTVFMYGDSPTYWQVQSGVDEARSDTEQIRPSSSASATSSSSRKALRHFDRGPRCSRLVIDMSGDGTPNAGGEVGRLRRTAERSGVTVNGLAIEGLGRAITNFYIRNVITADGFVETARGHRDYARAIRRKILREISTVFG